VARPVPASCRQHSLATAADSREEIAQVVSIASDHALAQSAIIRCSACWSLLAIRGNGDALLVANQLLSPQFKLFRIAAECVRFRQQPDHARGFNRLHDSEGLGLGLVEDGHGLFHRHGR
jgi:hypothetical protein